MEDIHNAAASLLLEFGWTGTTIAMIAAKAGISNRTFFNHYSTKEDAALGLRTLSVPEEALAAFTNSTEDLLKRTVFLTLATLRSALPEDGQSERRTRLTTVIPELRMAMKTFTTSAGDLIEPILIEKLTTEGASSGPLSQFPPRDSAMALRMLAGTVIRYAFAQDPTSLSADHSEQLIAAVSTFREVAAPHND